MASKLALGIAGLAMTAALGTRLRFTTGGMFNLTAGVMIGCIAAAWLLAPHR